MAKISGITAGFAPNESSADARKKNTATVTAPAPGQPQAVLCRCCEGHLRFDNEALKKNRLIDPELCPHCVAFFGNLESDRIFTNGVTDVSAKASRKRVVGAREAGYVMILRDGAFGANGVEIEIAAGDILLVPQRAADSYLPGQPVTKERTWGMFTLEVLIGPHPLTLFADEFSPIAFATVMALRDKKEIEETFVSTDDTHGHFRPTTEMRRQIEACFGRLIKRQHRFLGGSP